MSWHGRAAFIFKSLVAPTWSSVPEGLVATQEKEFNEMYDRTLKTRSVIAKPREDKLIRAYEYKQKLLGKHEIRREYFKQKNSYPGKCGVLMRLALLLLYQVQPDLTVNGDR